MSTAAASTPAPDPKPRLKPGPKPGWKKNLPQTSNSPSPESTTSSPDDEPAPPKRLVYVARKKMKVDGQQLKPGDVVPGADKWLRVESWVRAGYLNEEWR